MNSVDHLNRHALRDNRVIRRLVLEGWNPDELVLLEFLPDLRRTLLYCGLGVVLGQVFLFLSWGIPIESVAVFGQYPWLIPFSSLFVAVSLVLSQVFLNHENAHHEVFRPVQDMTQHRISLLLLSATLTFVPLVLFIPNSSDGFPPNIPLRELYSVISSIVVLHLCRPYLSKLAWDYWSPSKQTLKRYSIVFYGTVTTSSAIFLFGTWFTNPAATLGEAARLFAISLGVGILFLKPMYDSINKCRDGEQYIDRESNKFPRIDRLLQDLRLNRAVSLVSGIVIGVSLPVVAGLVIKSNLAFGNLSTVGDLVFWGYIQLVAYAVLLFLVWLAFGIVGRTVCNVVSRSL